MLNVSRFTGELLSNAGTYFYSVLVFIALAMVFFSKKDKLKNQTLLRQHSSKLEERTQELEKINQDNSTLLSIVCHDISTPVMIANYSLAKLVASSAFRNPVDMNNIDKIVKSLNAVAQILRRVKDIHAGKLGKLEPHVQALDLAPLIFETTQMFQPLCEEKNITLHFSERDNTKKIVMIDPLLFKNQILGNLISNAIKFSDRGQKIDVQLSLDKNEVVVEIIDYGKGIERTRIENLFDLNRATTTIGTQSESGTGLGLPTVKMITEKMGGRICVLSEKGTTFSLNFKLVA